MTGQDNAATGAQETSSAPPMTPPGGFPTGPRPAPVPHPGAAPYGRAPYPGAQPYPGPYVPGPRPTPTGPHGALPTGPYAWDPADDVDDPRPAGNAAAAFSVVLGLLAVLISCRPLAFGSMVMAWDTYVALGVAVLALVLGGVALRTPVRRPVAVVGMTLSVLALLVVAVLPTI
jgi:hypothetical protein